jgi:hypothetical protein
MARSTNQSSKQSPQGAGEPDTCSDTYPLARVFDIPPCGKRWPLADMCPSQSVTTRLSVERLIEPPTSSKVPRIHRGGYSLPCQRHVFRPSRDASSKVLAACSMLAKLRLRRDQSADNGDFPDSKGCTGDIYTSIGVVRCSCSVPASSWGLREIHGNDIPSRPRTQNMRGLTFNYSSKRN